MAPSVIPGLQFTSHHVYNAPMQNIPASGNIDRSGSSGGRDVAYNTLKRDSYLFTDFGKHKEIWAEGLLQKNTALNPRVED